MERHNIFGQVLMPLCQPPFVGPLQSLSRFVRWRHTIGAAEDFSTKKECQVNCVGSFGQIRVSHSIWIMTQMNLAFRCDTTELRHGGISSLLQRGPCVRRPCVASWSNRCADHHFAPLRRLVALL
ncbi:hypothetical protein BR93DRAFT_82251 [Coniochaeta sp. PMI_546]|nr:hypothetical protein BR93DRAFT_82251 [Coniochaeta sp. PMI_546]